MGQPAAPIYWYLSPCQRLEFIASRCQPQPVPPDAMRAYAVRTVVNSPNNDTSECIEPVA